MDPTEILSRLADEENPPTDEELSEALAEFKALGRDAVANHEPEEAKTLRQAVEVIQTEIDRRADIEAAKAAEAEELMETFDEPAEAEEATPEEEPEPEAHEVDVLEAIKLAANNRRAHIEANAQPENPYPHVQIRTVGQASAYELDHEATVDDVARIFAKLARSKDVGRQTFVSMDWTDIYGDERTLDKEAKTNYSIIQSVLGEGATNYEAVAAAGGICGPLEAVFDIPAIGGRGRPVRDALTRFGADRGGVRYIAAPRLSLDPVPGSTAVWTAANDTSPASPAEKPCLHIECEDECTAEVDAITACLTVGNFLARFSTEQWANALHFLGLEHDRTAEQKLLADIDAGSIDTTFTPGSGGTINGVLGAVDRAVSAIRSRERLSPSVGFRLILDGWLRPALRSQFTAQAPAGQTGAPGIADAALNQWFAARGVTVTYTQDDAIFGAQADGALLDFPATTTLRVFPEGTWWFLDGGTLDLGTDIVDSSLIAENNRQAFVETFERATKRTAPCDAEGDDSLTIDITVDEACLDACATGSP